MNKLVLIILLIYLAEQGIAQSAFSLPKEKNRGRTIGVATTQGVLYGGSLLLLSEAWYKEHDRGSFHSFDDSQEWMQVDKAGHTMTAFTLAKLNYGMYRWAGISERKAVWLGGAVSMAYLTGIEVLDGFSTEWGFSWTDMAANTIGNGLFVGQQLAWGEQRMQLKFSAHLTNYAEQRPNVLGSGFWERMLKDYNGQTYWLSVNPSSFRKGNKGKFKWLNVAVGYGAEGMLGANSNADLNIEGALDIERYRQYYLSLDIDLTRIRTNSGFLKGLFYTLNMIKIPAPTLEFNGKGEVEFHLLYF